MTTTTPPGQRQSWLDRVLGWWAGRSGAPVSSDASTPIVPLLERHARESMTIADVPPPLRRRIEEEALRRALCRLETPLRFLLYATTTNKEPDSLEEYRQILHLWRQGLEEELALAPDGYAGAVRSYEPEMEEGYAIRGTPRSGDPVRILVPSWRLNGEVAVRGEAEPLPATAPGTAPRQ